MPSATSASATLSLRHRTRTNKTLTGTFVKSPSHCVVEVLGLSGLDYVVIDAEHAPIGLHALDGMLLAARAGNLAALVRVPSGEPAFINSCLDAGASGVLVPHIRTARHAAEAVAACRYKTGIRGFSPSPRAGRYGTVNVNDYLTESDNEINVWCQIEDAEALENLGEIADVQGIDCLFIGRQDLAVSLGVGSIHHSDVDSAVKAIAGVGTAKSVPVGIFISDPAEIATLKTYGISIFICGSDQSLLLAHAKGISALAASTD